MNALEARIDQLLAVPPYSLSPEDREPALLALLKDELEYACSRSAAYRNYVRHWPIDPRASPRVADLPYLPVSLLKADPPFALVEAREIKKTLTLSSTTGQVPSRIALDVADLAPHEQSGHRHRAGFSRRAPPTLSCSRCAGLGRTGT